MSKLKKALPIVLIACLLAVAAVGVYKYYSTSNEVTEYTAEVAKLKAAHTKQTQSNSGEANPEAEIDHAALKEQNPDYLGWLTIPSTNIDYPLCACKEEEPNYYLNYTFAGKRNKFGNPFLDIRCDLDTSDVLFVYAHHNNLGTMFSELHGYKDKDFWNEHKTITIDTAADKKSYTVFAAILADGSYTEDEWSIFECLNLSKLEFAEMVDNIGARKIYETEISIEYGDRLLTLVTCEYSKDNNRLVVLAKQN